MSTSTLGSTGATDLIGTPRDDARRPSFFRILRLETRCEMLKLLRLPGFVVPTFAFPILFYLLFGVLLARHFSGDTAAASATARQHAAAYLLISYAAFGVFGANLHALGGALASERGKGWMTLKRSTPMPPLAHFGARLLVGLAFGGLVVLALFAVGSTLGGVRLERSTWMLAGLWLTLGGVPFAALGLALGHRLRPDAAPAVINLLYLPMSFASGLWIPISMLPDSVQAVAPWLPPFHVGIQGHRLLGMASSPPTWSASIAYLCAVTAICLAVATLAWRRADREAET